MAGGGAGCDLNGACCDGNITGKNEGDTFVHNAGGSQTPVPLYSFCLLYCYITPQIYISGSWVDMEKTSATPTHPITTNITNAKSATARPCSKVSAFTFTCQPGSGGTTWSCRYKVTAGIYTYYCSFTVEVLAPDIVVPLYYQQHTP